MANTKEQPRVVVLAGAGASKAVNPPKFPTTVEFFEGLPDTIQANGHFQFVKNFLTRDCKIEVVDIELILWELQNLIAFYKSVNDQTTIVGRSIAQNLIHSVNRGYNYGHLQQGASDLCTLLGNLQDQINEQVYDLYSYEPSTSELKDTWLLLIDALLDGGVRLDLFTTNYDMVIESALQALNGDELMYSYLGAKGGVQRYLDLTQWQEDADRPGGLLTKLHGSLNWKIGRERIAIGDNLFTGDHARQAIIYPGFKSRSNILFFDPFHDYFSRMLAQAHHVLVVGFAFRDDTINQIFRTSLAPSASVTVVDPAKEVKFPIRRKVSRVVDGFASAAITSFLKTATTRE